MGVWFAVRMAPHLATALPPHRLLRFFFAVASRLLSRPPYSTWYYICWLHIPGIYLCYYCRTRRTVSTFVSSSQRYQEAYIHVKQGKSCDVKGVRPSAPQSKPTSSTVVVWCRSKACQGKVAVCQGVRINKCCVLTSLHHTAAASSSSSSGYPLSREENGIHTWYTRDLNFLPPHVKITDI